MICDLKNKRMNTSPSRHMENNMNFYDTFSSIPVLLSKKDVKDVMDLSQLKDFSNKSNALSEDEFLSELNKICESFK